MMIFKSVIVLMSLVFVNPLSIALDSDVDAISLNNNTTPIVKAPWHVSIRINGFHNCSGAIIGDDWVITSAQCVFSCECVKPMVTIKTSSGSTHNLHSYVIHPSFELDDGCSLPQNDVGLLQILDSFNFHGDHALQIINIYSSNSIPGVTLLNVTHWNQEFAGGKFFDTLKMSPWLTVSDEQCLAFYYSMKSGNGMNNRFCAVNSDNHNDIANPCVTGDLGDPLVLKGKLVGIKSWKLDCTIQSQSPTIFTYIQPHIDWIKRTISPVEYQEYED